MKLISKKYLDLAREAGGMCLVCSSQASEVHHESVSNINRYYKRYNDYAVIPLCKYHHDLRHRLGKERFWKEVLNHIGMGTASDPEGMTIIFVAVFLLSSLYYHGFISGKEQLKVLECLQKFDDASDLYNVMDKLSEVAHRVVEEGEDWRFECPEVS